MISYCIACYRPIYARLLIADLLRKTSVPFEVLLWINTPDAEFTKWAQGLEAPVRVLGVSPENRGMSVYPELFRASRFNLTVQIDDDVIAVSPLIAEWASLIFASRPECGMLAADVWQDEHTTGARPTIENYRLIDPALGLHEGPIDGWFAVYRRDMLLPLLGTPVPRYLPLGGAIHHFLRSRHRSAYLCTRMKVFHVIGPHYAQHFGMLEFEIEKYKSLGRGEIVDWYQSARPILGQPGENEKEILSILQSISDMKEPLPSATPS